MGWLEDFLHNYYRQQNALMTASGAAAGTGGAEAPPPGVNAPQMPGAVGEQSNIAARSEALGGLYGADPLIQAARRGYDQGTPSAPNGMSLVGSGAATKRGPRAGLFHQTVDLGEGLRANVYYDPKTKKRQVFRFRA